MLKRLVSFFLILLFSISFTSCTGLSKWRTYYYTGNLKIEEAYICADVTDNLEPIKIGNHFTYGIKMVCLWFKYSYSDSNVALLRVRWYYQGYFIYQKNYYLKDREGVRAFYLFLSSGDPLPRGNYEVRMMYKGKVIKTLKFSIDGGES